MYVLFPPWLFVSIILASWLVHPLTILLFLAAFFAIAGILAKAFGIKLKQKISQEKSINVVATMNPEAEHRLILCGRYDSARVYSKFAQKYLNILRDISPFLDLACLAYFTMLIVKGTYPLVVGEFDFASLLELSPKMIGVLGVVWWAYLIVFACHTLLLTYSIIFSYRGEEFSYGADDNASGFAVMMETARRLQGNPAKAGGGPLILRRIFRIPLKKNNILIMKWIHTENDTVDKIDEQNLEESVQLVVKFVQKLNKKVEQYNGRTKLK